MADGYLPKRVASIVVVALMVAVAVVGIFASVPGGAGAQLAGAHPAPPQPAQGLTLSPGNVASGLTTQLEVTASTISFAAGQQLYVEATTTGTWVVAASSSSSSSSSTCTTLSDSAPCAWVHLSAGVTTIATGTLTPDWSTISASSYFLVSASADGSSGVYASQLITVVPADTAPTFTASPTTTAVGDTVAITGSGYTAGDSVSVYFYPSITEGTIGWSAATLVASTTASATGAISTSFTVPSTSGPTSYLSVIDTTQSIYGYATTADPTTFAPAIAISESITVSPSTILPEQSFTIAGTGFAAGTTIDAASISIGTTPTVSGFTTTPAHTTVSATGTFSITVNTAGTTFSDNAAGSTTVTVVSAIATLVFSTPQITVSPTSIIPGGSFTVSGSNFAPGSTIAANSVTVGSGTAKNSVQTVSASGTFSFSVATNAMTTFSTGTNTVTVTATQTGVRQSAATSIKVLAGKISISPTTISPGGSITITGTNFYPSATIGANSIIVGGATGTNPAVTVSATGGFTVTVSTLSFTGTLASLSTAAVSVAVQLPAGVTVDSSTSEPGTAQVNLLSPQVTINYPVGTMSLTAGETFTVTVTSFFPGATIAKNTVTFDSVHLVNAVQTIPSSGTLTFSVTIPAHFSPSSGVYALEVPEVAPNSLSISPSDASVYAILSTPTLNALTVFVNDSTTTPSAGPLSEMVGTPITVWLFGYPAAVTVSVTMGSDVVIASATTDANGGFFGTFMVPALPGSAAGVSYSVSTTSPSGLVATNPAAIKVMPELTLTGTEPYFNTYCTASTGVGCFLQAGDSFTLTGTGFDAVASVSLGNTPSTVDFPAAVMTDGTGSFSISATVDAADMLTTNTIDTVTASTTNSGTLTAMWDELAAPTLSIVSSSSSTALTTAGGAPIATGGELASFSVTGISYTVSSPVSTGPTGLTHGSDAGAMAISATAATGVYTATITPSDSTFPSGTATFAVSNPSAAGYLANSTGGSIVDTTPGSMFMVYALGFSAETSSSIALGSPSATAFTSFISSYTYPGAGGAIFSVTVSSSAAQGSYLVFGMQASSSYTTSIADSITVNIGAVFTAPGSVSSGASFSVSGTGFTPNSVFSVYFGDGVHAGANIGTLTSDGSGVISSTTLTAPLLAAGTYEIGVAPYTVASTIPVSSVFPATLQAISVTNNVVWTPDPSAFPGELVSFVYSLTGPLSPVPIAGTTQMLVTLNGADYALVPVTYQGAPTNTLSGSFTMFNGAPGSTYTLAIQPVYQTAQPRISNDTQTVAFTAPSTPVTEIFTWSIPAGSGTIASVNGFLSDTTTGGLSPLAGDFSFSQPTATNPGSVTLIVPAGSQTATDSYTATVTIELNSGNGIPTTVTGPVSSETPLTLVNGSGALVLSISHSDIVEIATLSGAFVNITLAQLNATINKIYSLNGQMYASLISGFGNMTVSLSAINATVTSVSDGIVSIQTTLGAISTSIVDLNATVVGVAHGLVELTSAVGNLTVSFADLSATVTGIANGVAVLATSVGQISVQLTELNATVGSVVNGIATIQTSLGTVTATLSAIGATVVSIASNVVEVNTTLGMIGMTLDQINANVTGVANGVMTLTTDVGQISVALADLNATVASIHGTVLTLVTDMGTVEASLASLNASVTALGVTSAQISANVNSLLGATADINTTVGNIQGKVVEISGSVAQISTSLGTLTMNVSKLQGTANTIQSQTSSTPNVTTYLIIVIVLAIIAIAVGLFAVMRVNAVARRLEGHNGGTRPGQPRPPSGGAGGSEEPPK